MPPPHVTGRSSTDPHDIAAFGRHRELGIECHDPLDLTRKDLERACNGFHELLGI